MDLYSWATVLEGIVQANLIYRRVDPYFLNNKTDVVGKYSTPAATFWLICTSFRLFTVVQGTVIHFPFQTFSSGD